MSIELAVKNRNIFGKKTKILRKNGLVPAELYGPNIKNLHLSILEKDFRKVYKKAGEHAIIELILENGEKMSVLISNVQYNTLHEKFISIDLRHIKIGEKISATIPIILKGEAPAIKAGLVLFQAIHELPIESLPSKIPNKFEIDISNLKKSGDSVLIKDLNIDKNIKILINEDAQIISIHEKKIKEVEKTEEIKTEEEGIEKTEEIKTEEEGIEKTEEIKK